MEYKPWPLLILAFFHFIEPVSKLTFYSVFFAMNPFDIIAIEYTQGNARHVFEYFFLFPVAGIAIFAVKKWSFPVFIGVELWAFISNLPYLSELYQSNQYLLFSFFILFAVLNVTVVSYLLLPAVKIAYMDPKIRWWEAKPRYYINSLCNINNALQANIKNISESGIFITTPETLKENSVVELTTTITSPANDRVSQTLSLKAEIVHHFSIDNEAGYGARYTELTKDDKRKIHGLLRSMEKDGVKRRPPRRDINDLVRWIKTVLSTGEGLIPSSHNR